jgi:DNA-binding response OmpR family regulator
MTGQRCYYEPRLACSEGLYGERQVILVVDDDTLIQNIVVGTLDDSGFEPAVASSGEDALTLLNANRYRVLVIDISLGRDRIKGWDVARRARAIDPSLAIIYITGGSADEWAIQGVPNSTLLKKPFATAQLATAVSRLISTGLQLESLAPPMELLVEGAVSGEHAPDGEIAAFGRVRPPGPASQRKDFHARQGGLRIGQIFALAPRDVRD